VTSLTNAPDFSLVYVVTNVPLLPSFSAELLLPFKSGWTDFPAVSSFPQHVIHCCPSHCDPSCRVSQRQAHTRTPLSWQTAYSAWQLTQACSPTTEKNGLFRQMRNPPRYPCPANANARLPATGQRQRLPCLILLPSGQCDLRTSS
jgi:hypothetical protein